MDLSILIPARNEQFVGRTVRNILRNIKGDTEVIVVLDGVPADPPLPASPRVLEVLLNKPIGQRAATNLGARLSDAKYIMKCDAHCSFGPGFDVIMMADMQDDWTMVPMMYNLHAFDWVCECGWSRYQGPSAPCEKCGGEMTRKMYWKAKPSPETTAMRFDKDLKFQYWSKYKKRQAGDLVDTMSLLGACWMLTREKYWELDICDEGHGGWGAQGTEVSCKTILSGGRLVCTKKTWFAHLFRTQGKDFGFPYPISGNDVNKARKYSRQLWLDNSWDKAIYPLSHLLEKFWPIPEWSDDDYRTLKVNEMNADRSGIYSIKNENSGKIYIGSAISLSRRFSEHLRMLRRNDHDNPHLQHSWDKHGEDAFSFNIEYFCDVPELIAVEQQFIDQYAEELGWDNLYNIARTAGSPLGLSHTPEAIAKMSEQQSGEGNGFYGKRHSEESIEKMRESHMGQVAWNRGIPQSDEVKEKISIANTGKPGWNKGLTAESDERIRQYAEKLKGKRTWEKVGHPRGMLGKHHTEEVKARISQSCSKAVKSRPRNERGHFIKAPSKGIVYYTDNRLDERIMYACQNQLEVSRNGHELVSVSLRPTLFGQNITLDEKRGYLTMFKQILAGLEASTADVVYLAEHDCMYHPSHFEFTPPRRDVFYYNQNRWMVDAETGRALHHLASSTSGLCAYRELLLEHYRKRVEMVEAAGKYSYRIGFEPGTHNRAERVDDYKAETWMSEEPNIDLRHEQNLTPTRWSKDQFRNQKYTRGWTEADAVPGWGKTGGRMSEFLDSSLIVVTE